MKPSITTTPTLSPASTSSTISLNEQEIDLSPVQCELFPPSHPVLETKRTTRKKFLLGVTVSISLISFVVLLSVLLTSTSSSSSSQEDNIPAIAPVAIALPKQSIPPSSTTNTNNNTNNNIPIMSSLAPVLPPPTPSVPVETMQPTRIAFDPGNLIKDRHGLMLSVGLQARIIAQSGTPVTYEAGPIPQSPIPFHKLPDFGACFPDPRIENPGGWIYVSNSEVRRPWYQGGVGAITFNAEGEIIDYRMILEGTTSNCGGGVTPWGTWVTGEEYRQGLFWQVDPTGQRPAEILTVGNERGMYESFAADSKRNQYFITEDFETGPVRRFVPSNTNPSDPWTSLHGDGETTYLRLIPTSERKGTYEWIKNKSTAQANAKALYPNSEGIDVNENQLYFVSKKILTVFVLDLEGNTYTSFSTRQGLFQGQPDQIIHFKNRTITGGNEMMMFFTEDGSTSAGVHARTPSGELLTIMEGPTYSNEVTGLAFSPDYKRMYVAYQDDGVLFEVVRDDGLPFTARSLNLRYHSGALNAIQ